MRRDQLTLVAIVATASALALTGCGGGTFDKSWVDRGGNELQAEVVSVYHGSRDCFDGVTFLHLGWPPGTASRFQNGPHVRQYVRDPEGTFPRGELAGPYSGNASLPPDARDTGFRAGEWRLWVAPGGRAVYLAADRRVERWPWIERGFGCV